MYFCTLIMAQHFVTLHLKSFLVENCGLSTMRDTFSGVEPFPILSCCLCLFLLSVLFIRMLKEQKKAFFGSSGQSQRFQISVVAFFIFLGPETDE